MFTFGTIVKVVAGFYIGCTGTVVDYLPETTPPQYQVYLSCTMHAKKRSSSYSLMKFIDGAKLEAIK